MGMVVATTFALILWIVLWAIGFGRVGDAFIVSFPLITVVAAMLRTVSRNLQNKQSS